VFSELGKLNRDNRSEYEKSAVAFMNNEYQQIEKLDDNLREEYETTIASKKNLTRLTPMSFFLDTGNEISSLGLDNFIEFYKWLQKQKRAFLQFHINKVFHGETKKPQPFNDSHLFFAHSRLPDHFVAGVLHNMLFVLVTLLMGSVVFQKMQCRLDRHKLKLGDFKVTLFKDDVVVLNSAEEPFRGHFVNIFFGESNIFGNKIDIEGHVRGMETRLLYLPRTDKLPHYIRVLDYLDLFRRALKPEDDEYLKLKDAAGIENLHKKFSDLDKTEKAKIMLALSESGKIKTVIFDDFDSGFNPDDRTSLQQRMAAHKEKGIMVVAVIGDDYIFIDRDVTITPVEKDGKFTVNVFRANRV
jgi:hypothetical protein